MPPKSLINKMPIGSVIVIHRKCADIICEVTRPDWKWLKGNSILHRVATVPEMPSGPPPCPDDIYSNDDVSLLGQITDPDIQEKIKRHSRGQRYELLQKGVRK